MNAGDTPSDQIRFPQKYTNILSNSRVFVNSGMLFFLALLKK